MIQVTDFWIDPPVRPALEQAGLTDVEALVTREFDWFEAPNRRRGGWSGVTRLILPPDSPGNESLPIFFKIQQNHYYVSWRNAYRKRLSYQREFHAIQSLRPHFACVPKPLLYIEWRNGGDRGCAIATEALEQWTCLEDWLSTEPERKQINAVLEALAGALRALHHRRWAHYGLFQKHIFLRLKPKGPEIKFIDFEKSRRCLTRRQCLLEDVSRFLRHSKNLDEAQQIRFLQAYFETDCLQGKHRSIIRRMRGVPPLNEA